MDKIGYLSLELLEAASAMLKASEEKDVKECENLNERITMIATEISAVAAEMNKVVKTYKVSC